jgi:putative oxidoreductase
MATTQNPQPGEDPGIRLVRLLLAVMMGIHGVTRLVIDGVGDFGLYLTETGFPMGTAIAWAITLFEVIGSTAIALRFQVVPIAILFALELTMGIVLVHAPEGWFVVGAGRNGMEYSVLLVGCFVALAIAERARRAPPLPEAG